MSSSYDEWQKMATDMKKRYPLASKYLGKVRTIFDEFDKDKDDKLSLNECASMFESLSKKVTSLPAVSLHKLKDGIALTRQTAQVASQQGKYLGKMFGRLAKQSATLKANDIPQLDDEAYWEPFNYFHLGSLAYIGNSYVSVHLSDPADGASAVFDYDGFSLAGGLLAMYAWRS